MIISPSDLTYFIEVSQTKNLSRAAERIGISQPSLTLAIRRIEGCLGTDVLIRSKRGVDLTKAGEKLLKHSKILLQYWEQVRAESLSSVNEIEGALSLGCHPSVGLYTLGKFLPTVFENYQNLEVSLHHDLSRNITESVVSLEIDIGIVINPVKHPDLIIHNLCEDFVTLWDNGDDKDILNPKSGKGALICDLTLLQTQNLMRKLKKKDFKFSRIITSNNLENIAELTSKGAGIGIIPSRVADKTGVRNLKTVEGAPRCKDTLSVIYRVENRKIKSLQYLVGEIIKSIN